MPPSDMHSVYRLCKMFAQYRFLQCDVRRWSFFWRHWSLQSYVRRQSKHNFTTDILLLIYPAEYRDIMVYAFEVMVPYVNFAITVPVCSQIPNSTTPLTGTVLIIKMEKTSSKFLSLEIIHYHFCWPNDFIILNRWVCEIFEHVKGLLMTSGLTSQRSCFICC